MLSLSASRAARLARLVRRAGRSSAAAGSLPADAPPAPPPPPPSSADAGGVRWATAGVPSWLQGRLGLLRVGPPTPVQAAALRALGCGDPSAPPGDALIHAETGSGKTLAYLVPALARVPPGAAAAAKLRAVVVCPTRELATQVAGVAARLGAAGKLKDAARGARVLRVVGEVTAETLHALKAHPPHVLVGTPRTLAALLPAHVNCGELQMLVLDEADELVRNHHVAATRAVARAVRGLRARPGIVAVSATSSFGLQKFAAEHMHRHTARVDLLDGGMGTPAGVAHLLLRLASPAGAYPAFTRALAALRPAGGVLSFHNSAATMEALEAALRAKGVRARVLGAAYAGAERARALGALAGGAASVLLATEMGARGLDLPRLTHVVNFDVPASLREYVHRVGRVGRLSSPGRAGTAVTFVADEAEAGRVVGFCAELGVPLGELTLVAGEPVVTPLLGAVDDVAAWRRGATARARRRDGAAAAAAAAAEVAEAAAAPDDAGFDAAGDVARRAGAGGGGDGRDDDAAPRVSDDRGGGAASVAAAVGA